MGWSSWPRIKRHAVARRDLRGRRLRARCRPMPEVVIVPTGTANIASVMAAFRRLGAEPRVSERRGGRRRGVACHAAGRRHVRRGRCSAWSSTGWTATLRDADRGGPADHRHLRRPPAPVRDQRREPRRARARRRPGPCRPVSRRCARAAVRLERGAARARARRCWRAATPISPTATGRPRRRAGRWRRPPMAARSWRPWSAATSSAASSIPSSPAPMARRCWRASWSCG